MPPSDRSGVSQASLAAARQRLDSVSARLAASIDTAAAADPPKACDGAAYKAALLRPAVPVAKALNVSHAAKDGGSAMSGRSGKEHPIALKEMLASGGLKLQHEISTEISARTEAITSLIGQLTRRAFTPRADPEADIVATGVPATARSGPLEAATAAAPPVGASGVAAAPAAAPTAAAAPRVPALRLPLASSSAATAASEAARQQTTVPSVALGLRTTTPRAEARKELPAPSRTGLAKSSPLGARALPRPSAPSSASDVPPPSLAPTAGASAARTINSARLGVADVSPSSHRPQLPAAVPTGVGAIAVPPPPAVPPQAATPPAAATPLLPSATPTTAAAPAPAINTAPLGLSSLPSAAEGGWRAAISGRVAGAAESRRWADAVADEVAHSPEPEGASAPSYSPDHAPVRAQTAPHVPPLTLRPPPPAGGAAAGDAGGRAACALGGSVPIGAAPGGVAPDFADAAGPLPSARGPPSQAATLAAAGSGRGMRVGTPGMTPGMAPGMAPGMTPGKGPLDSARSGASALTVSSSSASAWGAAEYGGATTTRGRATVDGAMPGVALFPDAGTGDVEAMGHELQAARIALRDAKQRHARDLDAVRRGWHTRCEELSRTVQRLRLEMAQCGAPPADDLAAPANPAGPPTVAGRSPAIAAADGLPAGAPLNATLQGCASPPRLLVPSIEDGSAEDDSAAGGGALRGGGGGSSPLGPMSQRSPSSQRSPLAATAASEKGASPRSPPSDKLDALTIALSDAQGALVAAAAEVQTARAKACEAEAVAADAQREAARWQCEAEAARQEALTSARELERVRDAASTASAATARASEAAKASEAVATARDAEREARFAKLAEQLEVQLAALATVADAFEPDAVVEGDVRRAIASAEGRLHLEQSRHAQQIERLQFENEELRRATRVKSERIADLRAQLGANA